MRNNYSLSKALNVYSFILYNNFLNFFSKNPLVATSSKGKKINLHCSLCFALLSLLWCLLPLYDKWLLIISSILNVQFINSQNKKRFINIIFSTLISSWVAVLWSILIYEIGINLMELASMWIFFSFFLHISFLKTNKRCIIWFSLK